MSETLITVGKFVNWPREKLLLLGVTQEEINASLAEQITADAHRQIDELADRAYTTSASRSARYQRKEQEARAFVADAAPVLDNYPMLVAEAAARGSDVVVLANEVIAKADAYHQLAAVVEAQRATARVNIEAAQNEAGMRNAARVAVQTVETVIAQATE